MAVEDAPLYWDAVWAFVAVGQIDKAEQYLAMHSVNQLPPSALTAHVVQPSTQRQRELVETAVVLLQRMPRMPAAVGGGALTPLGQVHTSAVELMRHRERWRELCLKTLQDESIYDDCPVRDPPTPPLEIVRSVPYVVSPSSKTMGRKSAEYESLLPRNPQNATGNTAVPPR
jgi:hypothetical protein